MPGHADLARLNRDIDELEQVVATTRGKLKDTDRRALRSEIERCMQRLDELRHRLGG
ncbi:MAG: hypothetical protein P4M09_27375 [Devosia sp.]|nr:hypothetical protein [Devosia sp.]